MTKLEQILKDLNDLRQVVTAEVLPDPVKIGSLDEAIKIIEKHRRHIEVVNQYEEAIARQ